MGKLIRIPKPGVPSLGNGWKMADDYPIELREEMDSGFGSMFEAAEEFYAEALSLGISDPDDSRIGTEMFAGVSASMFTAMAKASLRKRLRVAQAGYTRCYLVEDSPSSS